MKIFVSKAEAKLNYVGGTSLTDISLNGQMIIKSPLKTI